MAAKLTTLSPFPECLLKMFERDMMMSCMFGMPKEEWERLKSLQREYNRRQSKMINWELVEKCAGITEELLGKSDDNDTTKDQETSRT